MNHGYMLIVLSILMSFTGCGMEGLICLCAAVLYFELTALRGAIYELLDE